jgi:hypothetical protein
MKEIAYYRCNRCGGTEHEARRNGCVYAPCPMELRSWWHRLMFRLFGVLPRKRELWVPVIEHSVRLRSCCLYTLKARRWFWFAKLCLRLQVLIFEGDCNAWIVSPERAEQMLAEYRNWLGENRLGA